MSPPSGFLHTGRPVFSDPNLKTNQPKTGPPYYAPQNNAQKQPLLRHLFPLVPKIENSRNRELLHHTTQPHWNLPCALPITPTHWCHWASAPFLAISVGNPKTNQPKTGPPYLRLLLRPKQRAPKKLLGPVHMRTTPPGRKKKTERCPPTLLGISLPCKYARAAGSAGAVWRAANEPRRQNGARMHPLCRLPEINASAASYMRRLSASHCTDVTSAFWRNGASDRWGS